MAGLEWAHAAAALIGAGIAAIGGIFSSGFRLGRIEERLKRHFQDAIAEAERRIEAKVAEAHAPFDETLKGLRQKINDVELNSERRYLPKDDFKDFVAEYRDDMRDLKELISRKTQ